MSKKKADLKQPDIVISSRIRLARNLIDYPFHSRLDRARARELLNNVSGILADTGFKIIDLTQITKREASALVERHLISPEIIEGDSPRGVALSEDESVSIMINEEDHLRIQVIGTGLCLEDCLEKAFAADDTLEKSLHFAFDEKLGYLTHCPTNLGTGMRASIMLHLPAFTWTGEIHSLIAAVSKLGFAVRGIYGEGSEAKGAIYQISNQLTLGLGERETVDRLSEAVSSIIDKERALRQIIRERDPYKLEDAAHRSLGLLATARRMSSGEAMALLSDLRIGVATGEIKGIDFETINRLLWEIQPNSLAETTGAAGGIERDVKRAEILRKNVREAIINEI